MHQLFEYWYKAYPNKKSRGDAEKAFEKLDPDADMVDEMLQSLSDQKADRAKKAKQGEWSAGWKLPATWIRQKCWLDEIKEEKTKVNVVIRQCGCGVDAAVYVGDMGYCCRCYTKAADPDFVGSIQVQLSRMGLSRRADEGIAEWAGRCKEWLSRNGYGSFVSRSQVSMGAGAGSTGVGDMDEEPAF